MKITSKKFNEDCIKLGKEIQESAWKLDGIYPIPRGGIPVAKVLSELLNIPIIGEYDITGTTLIVDDLIDSGKTLNQYNDNVCAVLYRKSHSPRGAFYIETINDWIEFPWEKTSEDKENLITRTLENIGENPNREGLLDTPKRVVKMWDEIYGGYKKDPADLFKAVFTSDYDQMVIVKDISFYSHCEHHMVPFFGKVHIGYIPDGKVLGISKFARLVDLYSQRLQIQEEFTNSIVNDIQKYLNPKGIMVVVEAEHLCMTMRGVKKPGAKTITSKALGNFMENDKTRAEFLSLIK